MCLRNETDQQFKYPHESPETEDTFLKEERKSMLCHIKDKISGLIKKSDIFAVLPYYIEYVILMLRVEKWNNGKVQKTRGFRELGQFGKVVPAPEFFVCYTMWKHIYCFLCEITPLAG